MVGPGSLGDGDGDGESLGEGDGDGESLGEGDGDGESLGEGDGDGESLGEGDGDGDGDGSGSGTGGEKFEKSELVIPTGVIVRFCADLSTRSVALTYIENARPAVGLRKSIGGVKLAPPGHLTPSVIWNPARSPINAPVEVSFPPPK